MRGLYARGVYAVVALLWLFRIARLLSWVMAFSRFAQQFTPGMHVISIAYVVSMSRENVPCVRMGGRCAV